MRKQEILNKIKDFLEKNKGVKEVYPDILEKHKAINITSGFADKLDTIDDPFDRFIIAVYFIDLMDENDIPINEMNSLKDRHKDLFMTIFYLNKNTLFEAGGEILFQAEIISLGDFDNYFNNFNNL